MTKKKTLTFSNFLIIKNNPDANLDSDNDGLNDYKELEWGTDPFTADTDGDGMNDGDEIKVGRNPLGPGLLKDFFIPHSGNDYKPHALNPKRLAFHAVSAIAIKTIIVLFLIAFPIEAWLMPDIMLEESKKIIELTNNIRSDFKLKPLQENSKLDQAAYEKAQDMLFKQYFAHVSPENKGLSDWLKNTDYNYTIAGENLAMGFSNVEDAVEKWKESPTHYSNLIDPDFTEIGVGIAGGSFNKVDTTFIAQFFGNQLEANQPREAISGQVKNILPKATDGNNQITKKENKNLAQNILDKLKNAIVKKSNNVLGEKEYSPEISKQIVTDPQPIIDNTRTSLSISEPTGQNKKIIEAIAYLNSEVDRAQIKIDENFLELQKDSFEPNKWTGDLIIFKEGNHNTPATIFVPATIQIWNKDGSTLISDIDAKNLNPIKPSIFKEYSLLRNHQIKDLKSMFSISSIYYFILLLLTIISLSLNIFIKIKKQNPKIILSSVGLICLLTTLIII